jgi:hypothetical protein
MSKTVISWIIGVVGLGGAGFAGVRAFILKLEKEVDLVISEVVKVQDALNKVIASVTPATPPAKRVAPASAKAPVKKTVAKRK